MLTFPLTLNVKPVNLSDEQFYQLCLANPDIPMERSRNGELIVMSPVGGYSGNQELELGDVLPGFFYQLNDLKIMLKELFRLY